jgi:hypothetical protein
MAPRWLCLFSWRLVRSSASAPAGNTKLWHNLNCAMKNNLIGSLTAVQVQGKGVALWRRHKSVMFKQNMPPARTAQNWSVVLSRTRVETWQRFEASPSGQEEESFTKASERPSTCSLSESVVRERHAECIKAIRHLRCQWLASPVFSWAFLTSVIHVSQAMQGLCSFMTMVF